MKSRTFAIIAGLTVGGLALRLYSLGEQSLWFDEAYSIFVAKLDLRFSFELLISDSVHPPLYYLIQRITAPLGDSEAMVRLPALLIGVISVPLIYVLGSRLSGERTGIFAAALAALSPFHIWYSQEARMYSALVMLAVLCMIAYLGILRSDRRARDDLLFVVVSGLTYVTHYFALFVPLIQLAHLSINFKRLHQHLIRWVLLQSIAMLPLVLWLIQVYRQPEVFVGIGWINQPALRDILYTLINFTTGFIDGSDPIRWFALILLGVMAALGARSLWQVKTAASFLLAWALLPVMVTFLISIRRPIYIDRFLILSLPAIWLLVANGLSSIPIRWRAVAGSVVILLMVYGIATFNFGPTQMKEDWRSAAEALRSARDEEVLIVRTLQMVIPMAYYYPDADRFESVEVNRIFTPISELAAKGTGSWLLYWNPASDAHSVSAVENLDLAGDSYGEVVNWMSGEGPTIKERMDLPGLSIFRFDELAP